MAVQPISVGSILVLALLASALVERKPLPRVTPLPRMVGFLIGGKLSPHSPVPWPPCWAASPSTMTGPCCCSASAALLTGSIREGQPMLLEALGIVLLCGRLAARFQESDLVAAMAMGAFVANLARHHDDPFHAIEGIELPFTALLFVPTGASLDVGSLRRTGPEAVGQTSFIHSAPAPASGVIPWRGPLTWWWLAVARPAVVGWPVRPRRR